MTFFFGQSTLNWKRDGYCPPSRRETSLTSCNKASARSPSCQLGPAGGASVRPVRCRAGVLPAAPGWAAWLQTESTAPAPAALTVPARIRPGSMSAAPARQHRVQRQPTISQRTNEDHAGAALTARMGFAKTRRAPCRRSSSFRSICASSATRQRNVTPKVGAPTLAKQGWLHQLGAAFLRLHIHRRVSSFTRVGGQRQAVAG